MYRKYRIVESIASSVSQYESYRDQVYRYTPSLGLSRGLQTCLVPTCKDAPGSGDAVYYDLKVSLYFMLQVS